MIIRGYRVVPLLKATGREILDDGLLGLAAGTAYYFFFSLFPLLLFVAPILSLVGDRERTLGWVMTQLASFVPGEAMTMVRSVVETVVYSESAPGIMSVGAALALWAGSNIFMSITVALNRAYDVDDMRPWWKRRLIAIFAVIASGAVLLISMVLMFGGDRLAAWVGSLAGLDVEAVAAWSALQVPVIFVLLVGMAWMLYYFLPNVKQRPRRALIGAVVATLLWLLVTIAFRFYVANFGAYNKTYGTIGGVIVLLTWMYLTTLVLLIGGELNAEIAKGTGAVRPPAGEVYLGRITTDGPGRTSTDRVAQGAIG